VWAICCPAQIRCADREPSGQHQREVLFPVSLGPMLLTFGWDPSQVWLVLGAAYVGQMDDLAVFNRALTDAEAKQLFGLKNGVREFYP
jgi:hypothetical protein